MRKLAACIVVAASPLLGSTAFAQGAPYPPPAVSLFLAPSTLGAGRSFTATFNGCSTGEAIRFTLMSDSDSATCANSAAAVTLTAPTAPGTYTVTATSTVSSASASLTVLAPSKGSTTPVHPTIPGTGTDSAPIALIAGGVLLAGIGLAAVAWYRRRSPVAG
jgi:LPXTG-motif cell wall-anchored protein